MLPNLAFFALLTVFLSEFELNIYVSNGFLGGSVTDSVALLHGAGFDNIELSNGSCNLDSLITLKKLHKQGKSFRLHNYFPNIGSPFVLNLSSADSATRRRSFDLIVKALEWSAELESDYYAFHAGFRLSPKVSELGGNLSKQDMISVIDAQCYFLGELDQLVDRAKVLGVEIAIENNVYDARNFARYGEDNPFLLSGDSRSDLDLPDGVGILLDVGHLNVSAHSLGLNQMDVIKRWGKRITGYHLSDNDGLQDSNSHIGENSWFLPALDPSIKRITLEVYDRKLESLKRDFKIVRGKFA